MLHCHLQALHGECGFMAANLYARSIFGEDALANLSIERPANNPDGPVTGHIRIRAKSQVGTQAACGEQWSNGFTGEKAVVRFHLLSFQSLSNFNHPTLPVSFRRDTENHWSLLPGVYARGTKKSHAGKFLEKKKHSCISPRHGCLE